MEKKSEDHVILLTFPLTNSFTVLINQFIFGTPILHELAEIHWVRSPDKSHLTKSINIAFIFDWCIDNRIYDVCIDIYELFLDFFYYVDTFDTLIS